MRDVWVIETNDTARQIGGELEKILGTRDAFLVTENGFPWVGGRIERPSAAWPTKLRR